MAMPLPTTLPTFKARTGDTGRLDSVFVTGPPGVGKTAGLITAFPRSIYIGRARDLESVATKLGLPCPIAIEAIWDGIKAPTEPWTINLIDRAIDVLFEAARDPELSWLTEDYDTVIVDDLSNIGSLGMFATKKEAEAFGVGHDYISTNSGKLDTRSIFRDVGDQFSYMMSRVESLPLNWVVNTHYMSASVDDKGRSFKGGMKLPSRNISEKTTSLFSEGYFMDNHGQFMGPWASPDEPFAPGLFARTHDKDESARSRGGAVQGWVPGSIWAAMEIAGIKHRALPGDEWLITAYEQVATRAYADIFKNGFVEPPMEQRRELAIWVTESLLPKQPFHVHRRVWWQGYAWAYMMAKRLRNPLYLDTPDETIFATKKRATAPPPPPPPGSKAKTPTAPKAPEAKTNDTNDTNNAGA